MSFIMSRHKENLVLFSSQTTTIIEAKYKKFADLLGVLINYQKEIFALVLASYVRVDVGRMLALQTAIRALKFRLAAARGA